MGYIQIDKEFSENIPPLSQEERQQLEENIVAEGCRDPLVIWGDVLLDGHNRFEICTRLDIPYKTKALDFENRDAAADWIDRNQLGRRNLSPDQMSLIRGRRYNRSKKAQGAPTGNANASKQMDQNDPVVSTAERLAKEHGVSPATIKRDGKYAEAVEKTKAIQPDIEKRVVLKQTPPKKTVIEAAKLIETHPEKAIAIHAGEKTIIQVKREIKEAKREERRHINAEMVTEQNIFHSIQDVKAKFPTIVIDPPWDWGDEGDQDQLGRSKPTYQTLSFQQLLELPVQQIADIDCHLYLWITNRSLPKGFGLVKSWGFRYVTCLTWAKPSFGLGNYYRGSSEHILFGVKGSQMLKRKDVGTWFQAKRGNGGHSSKPDEFYSMVESCSPSPFVDLFGRKKRDGWVVIGAETES